MPQNCMFCGDRYDMEHLDCRRLRFHEAMALDPSEVEVWAKGGWEPLERGPDHPTGDWVLSFLRVAKFRRSRPKRSRVEEMAAEEWPSRRECYEQTLFDYTKAIRAVCEWLREPDKGASDGAASSLSRRIEREFLEKRL